MKTKYSKKISLYVLSVMVLVSSTSHALDLSVSSMDNYTTYITDSIDSYYQEKDTANNNPYVALRGICQTLEKNNFEAGILNIVDEKGDTLANYSARGSLFVTILCNSLTSADESSDSKNENYPLNILIKTPTIWSLGIACKQSSDTSIQLQNQACAIRQKNSSTDYSYIFYNLVTYILNDISNLSIARSYGLIENNATTKDLSNAFAINTFNTIFSIPQQKNYPQTLKSIEKNIKLAKNIQQNTIVINTEKPLQEKKPDLCDRQIFLHYNQDNLSGCGHMSEVNMLAQYNGISIDLLYNELFFYNLFNQFYMSYLHKFRTDINAPKPPALQNSNTFDAISLQQQRAIKQQENLHRALQDTIRQINSTSSLYPIHIGLLMYQEGLLSLRNNLAKIYLPLHQLHYKLQNVQSVG